MPLLPLLAVRIITVMFPRPLQLQSPHHFQVYMHFDHLQPLSRRHHLQLSPKMILNETSMLLFLLIMKMKRGSSGCGSFPSLFAVARRRSYTFKYFTTTTPQ